MFESNATPEQYAAIDEQKRTFHVLTRTVGMPRPGDYIRIREVEPNATSAGNVATPTGRELYVRVRYVESLGAAGVEGVAAHGWIVAFELRIGTTRRMFAVRPDE